MIGNAEKWIGTVRGFVGSTTESLVRNLGRAKQESSKIVNQIRKGLKKILSDERVIDARKRAERILTEAVVTVRDRMENISTEVAERVRKSAERIRAEAAQRESAPESVAGIVERATASDRPVFPGIRKSFMSVRRYAVSVGDRMTVKERLLVFFAIGAVIGFGAKAIASGSLTIGYQDYTLKTRRQPYDLNEIERRLAEKERAAAADSVMGISTETPSESE